MMSDGNLNLQGEIKSSKDGNCEKTKMTSLLSFSKFFKSPLTQWSKKIITIYYRVYNSSKIYGNYSTGNDRDIHRNTLL